MDYTKTFGLYFTDYCYHSPTMIDRMVELCKGFLNGNIPYQVVGLFGNGNKTEIGIFEILRTLVDSNKFPFVTEMVTFETPNLENIRCVFLDDPTDETFTQIVDFLAQINDPTNTCPKPNNITFIIQSYHKKELSDKIIKISRSIHPVLNHKNLQCHVLNNRNLDWQYMDQLKEMQDELVKFIQNYKPGN